MSEFARYRLDISPTQLYSPASIGKAYLDQMGIQPFLEKNKGFSRELLGDITATYYGGRSEVRVRDMPMEIVLIDFLSMYPTMCILGNIWKSVIADRTQYDDAFGE